MRLLLVASLLTGLLCARTSSAQDAGTTRAAPPASASAASSAAPAPPSPAPSTPSPSASTGAAPPATAPAPAAAPSAAPKPAAAPSALTATTSPSSETTAKPGGAPAAGIGLSPTLPSNTGGTPITAKEVQALTPTSSGATADEWKFDFHGYLKAPLRMSIGPPTPIAPPSTYMCQVPPGTPMSTPGMPTCAYPTQTPAQAPYPPGSRPTSGTQFHEVPRVAGLGYGTWPYTNTVPGPWTQLNFTYGNSRVMATVMIDAYNVTDGSYKNLLAQQGIDQSFLTLNFPDFFRDYGGLVWNVGVFQNRYGTAGKYDGGMYETYLFGRIHQAGETLTANLSNLDPTGNWNFTAEDGFGGKIDIIPFLNNQYYQVFSNTTPGMPGTVGGNNGKPYLSQRDAEYFPWAGPVPQGSTFVHHAHLGAKYQKSLTLGLHYIYVWTPDDNWDPYNSTNGGNATNGNGTDLVPRSRGPIQGSIAVTGAEARLNGGVYGDGYVGYSHIDARNVNAIADILEVLHANGSGAAFKQTFFGQSFNAHTGVYNGPENETGTVDSVLFQYSFSFGQLARYPEEFWGDGPDLVVTAFGLMSIVDSKPPPLAVAVGPLLGRDLAHQWDMSTKKLKYGLDAVYTPFSNLGFGGRFDMVMPDLDAAYSRTPGNPGGSDLNFSVLTGRAIIKTQFITHESVVLQYQHYFLGAAAYASYPYEWLPVADADLLAISASMWW
jgi:hypothetical protein